MDELTEIVAVMDKAACVLAVKGADLLADRLKAAATFLSTKSAHANEVKAALQSDIDGYGKAEIRQVELDAITAWNTRAASGGDSASLEQRARLVTAILDWQPLTRINKGDRLYQVLEAAGLPFDQQAEALAAALANQQGVGDQ